MKYILASLFTFVFDFSFSQTITESQIDSLIDGIKKTVIENYVVTDKAKLICDSLSSIHYSNITLIDSLLKKLNQDLFYLSNDKHLFLQYRPAVAENLLKHVDIHADQNKKEKKEHYGFEKITILDGNIAYLKLNYFADATNAKKAVLKYIRHYKNTVALIIDLRNNFGGSGTMLQLLAGIFLPVNQDEILKINYRTGNVVNLKATQINPDKQYLKQPIYILCDSQTYSAGEAFAFIMKNRGRAVLIGATTAGAGNVAGPHPINTRFVLTIPVGIIVDPLTNTGWEHTGVTPDINTDAGQELAKAIELIQTKK